MTHIYDQENNETWGWRSRKLLKLKRTQTPSDSVELNLMILWNQTRKWSCFLFLSLFFGFLRLNINRFSHEAHPTALGLKMIFRVTDHKEGIQWWSRLVRDRVVWVIHRNFQNLCNFGASSVYRNYHSSRRREIHLPIRSKSLNISLLDIENKFRCKICSILINKKWIFFLINKKIVGSILYLTIIFIQRKIKTEKFLFLFKDTC